MKKHECGCPLSKFPVKYHVPVKTQDGRTGFVLLTQEQIDKINKKLIEKREIREVFE